MDLAAAHEGRLLQRRPRLRGTLQRRLLQRKKNAAEKDAAGEIAVEKAMGLTVAHAIGHRLGGSVRCRPQAGQQRTLSATGPTTTHAIGHGPGSSVRYRPQAGQRRTL